MGGHSETGDGHARPGETSRALQPRIVLVLLLGAALAGVWLTHLAAPIVEKLVAWATIITTGVLAGGTYWRLVFFDADAFDQPDHRRRVRAGWRRLETLLVWSASAAGAAYLLGGTTPPAPEPGRLVLGVGSGSAIACWYGVHRTAAAGQTTRTVILRAGVFAAAVASIVALAWLETGTTALDWIVRFGHLSALALWLGGAAWHNFVILPTIQTAPAAANAVKLQARAFRRHLPAVIAVLFATGAYQTVRLIGYSIAGLVRSPVGHLVGVKLLVLAALTGLVAVTVRRNASPSAAN